LFKALTPDYAQAFFSVSLELLNDIFINNSNSKLRFMDGKQSVIFCQKINEYKNKSQVVKILYFHLLKNTRA